MTAAALAGRLDAAEPVRVLREAFAAAGIEAWLVGGVVRDALLGRPLTDVDLAVRAVHDAFDLGSDTEAVVYGGTGR